MSSTPTRTRAALAAVAMIVLLALAGSGGSVEGAEQHVLAGTYTSGYQDRPERIRAVFSHRAADETEETWNVVFHFRFGAKDRTYRGIAEGSLTEGVLSGVVENEDGTRVFTFRGEHKKKRFLADHFEVLAGREEKTGAMTLKG